MTKRKKSLIKDKFYVSCDKRLDTDKAYINLLDSVFINVLDCLKYPRILFPAESMQELYRKSLDYINDVIEWVDSDNELFEMLSIAHNDFNTDVVKKHIRATAIARREILKLKLKLCQQKQLQ